jgi:hypothetical protein
MTGYLLYKMNGFHHLISESHSFYKAGSLATRRVPTNPRTWTCRKETFIHHMN